MKKRSKRENSLALQAGEPDVAGLINKMQQQLFALEKKIDVLISRSSERPFEGKHFSKPFQPFGRRERKFYQVICADCNKECEVPFSPSAGRPVYCRECFSKRKGAGSLFKEKHDNRPKERDFVQERHFDKQQGGENWGADQKKKPFSKRRKKR